MLLNASIIGFVPVSDAETAEAFYVAKLGLRLLERSPFALVVATAAGQTIRCVPVGQFTPQPFTILGWEVADIHSAVRDLRAAGIEPIRYPHLVQDADGVWAAPTLPTRSGAAQVVWFHDPGGNVLSLSQGAVEAQAQ